jgi:hypothetical protein
MRRVLRKTGLFLLAIIFLLEAWLWDITGAAIKRLLGWVPYHQLKNFIAKRVVNYSPWLTLLVFLIPGLILLPLKFITVFLLAKGYVLGGIATAATAKLAGLGISSFLFSLCKPKLLELRFIRWLYRHCIYWRERARVVVAPYTARAKALVAELRAKLPRGGMLAKVRHRVHSWRKEWLKREAE